MRITRADGGEVEHYAYDPSGDEIVRPGSLGIDYTSFHLPSRMRTRDADVRFTYDANGARVQKATDAETIAYVAGLYERVEAHDPGRRAIEHRVYVPGPDRTVAVLKFHDDGREMGARETLFVHQDYLGSLDAMSDPSGRIVERHSYDAFGAPRNPDWTKPGAPPRSANGSTIGFTAQEDDQELGLVNMRGRLYDPRRGRFLSADPRTPSALSIGWNRYAYANDNPLRFVDPSGFDAVTDNDSVVSSSATPIAELRPDGVLEFQPDECTANKSVGGSAADDAATATASGADAGTAQADTYARPPSTTTSGDASRGTVRAPTTLPRATREEHWAAGKAAMADSGIRMLVGLHAMSLGPLASLYQQWLDANVLSRIPMDVPARSNVAEDLEAGRNVTLTVVEALSVVAPMALEGAVVGEGAAIEGAAEAEGSEVAAASRPTTLKPGPFASESVPARGPARDFTRAEREAIKPARKGYRMSYVRLEGPRYKVGGLRPRSPASQLANPSSETQRLYPQCIACSRRQGGEIRALQQASE